jgi:hypothetical protein
MPEPDYTEIKDEEVRGKICEFMSEMLDNPGEGGIFPTSRFMWKMERYILDRSKGLQDDIESARGVLRWYGGDGDKFGPHQLKLANDVGQRARDWLNGSR